MNVEHTSIPDVMLFQPQQYEDERGWFFEAFNSREYAHAGVHGPFVQDNQSYSVQGVLRGLHYQIRQPQGKLVRVLSGKVFDAAVDLRRNSPTFGKWVGVTISAEDCRQVWIPPGFAHGFYVLSAAASILYKVTDYYAREWERTLRWDDPQLKIEWPLREGQAPILSTKDAAGSSLEKAEVYE